MFPIEWTEFIGAILLAITIAFCNAAGIGGGGIIVTILITLFFFSPKEAVAASNTVIFFGCLTRYIRNFNHKHPLKDATAIDYGIVTCQLPLVMLGTYIGVLVNDILPETLVFILLFVTLIYLTYKAIMKGYGTYKSEKAAKAKIKFEENRLRTSLNADIHEILRQFINLFHITVVSSNLFFIEENAELYKSEDNKFEIDHRTPLMNISEDHLHKSQGFHNLSRFSVRDGVRRINSRQSLACGDMIDKYSKNLDEEDAKALAGERRSTYKPSEINEKLEKLLALEKTHFRPRTIVVVLVPFFTILIIGLLRPSRSMESIAKIGRCSAIDHILLVIQILILVVLAIVQVILLKKEYNEKTEVGYQFVKGDVVWNTHSIIKFVIFACIAGFISGAVGLSGGILFTPLFLDFGIAPSVASGTSMFMAMFATLSSSILFMFGGYTIYQFAFWLSAFSIIGTAVGITVIMGAVKKSGKSSILVWLLAMVILASTIAEGIVGTLKTIGK